MKIRIKVVVFALVALFAINFASACKKNDDSGLPTGSNEIVYNGTHILTSPDTDKYLVKNGSCDYVVVVPENESAKIREAKNEFIYFFNMATGITLKTVSDTGLVHNENNRYISLGKTKLFESTGLQIDERKLDVDGVRIITKDNSVYLLGASDYGTLNAVYTFFEVTFGLEVYYYDCIEIEEGIKDKKLKNYDITDIPDIPLREMKDLTAFSDDYDVKQLGSRMRSNRTFYGQCYGSCSSYDDNFFDVRTGHNSNYNFLTESQYKSEHPKWYSDQGVQLCYTAHGDKDEYQAMLGESMKKIAYSIDRYYKRGADLKNFKYYNIFMEDNYEVCLCKTCSENLDKYGTHAASQIMFMNDLAVMFEDWANKPENAVYQAQDISLCMLAYQDFVEPPVKYDENKKAYVPIDEKVKMRHNVAVSIADIYIDFQQSFDAAEHDRTKRIVEGWGAVSNQIGAWAYVSNFKYNMYMYDTFSLFTGDTLAYYANQGCMSMYTAWMSTSAHTTFKSLFYYMQSKLQWNTSLDEQKLMAKWFKAMFKDAAPIMRDLFTDMRSYAAAVYSENDLYCRFSCYNKVENKELWHMGTLQQWITACDNALAAIEDYKISDSATYQTLKNHIDAESLSPIYILLKLYQKELSIAEKKVLCNRVLAMQDNLPLEYVYPNLTAIGSSSVLDFVKGII